MHNKTSIVWFRRDLRLADNPALEYASRDGGRVLPLYLVDWEDGDPWAPGKAGRWWLGVSLASLAGQLESEGAALLVAGGKPEEVLPRLAARYGAAEVVWNRLYEPQARRLDLAVETALRREGVETRSFGAALLFEPEGHLTRTGKPFIQFGAFWRSCLKQPAPAAPGGRPERLLGAAGLAEDPAGRIGSTFPAPSPVPTVVDAAPWQPGEAGAQARLARFLTGALADYETGRDIPGSEGVSRLSPHLHFGEIGPRQVWHAVRQEEAAGSPGADPFLRQLGWREFAHYLLYHFPDTPTEPFRPEFAQFPWADDPEGLSAWQQGSTGYPLVDAGMRQLAAEGWMHNRVRMVVASFLTKDLLVPWQQGAAWFWENLVDADLANNTLGWQWTAGSGPDAAPYFRVYNPSLQASRFDGDGVYIDRWLRQVEQGTPGPEPATPRVPIVDHAEARARALAAYRGLRRG